MPETTNKTIQQMRLNTLENSRKTFARLIRLYNADQISTEKFRTLCYAMSHYLSYWRLEKDIEIERRLDLIEDKLNDAG